MSDDFNTPYEILNAYQNGGLQGYIQDPLARAQFLDSQPNPYFSEPNIAGLGIGKRALLFGYLRALDPTAFSERQITGDCVAHGSRNARDMTRAARILACGMPHDFYKRGALEPTYGARGHRGQGMSPAVASRFERDYGFLSREDHGVVDLSTYSDIGVGWGGSGVPDAVKEKCKERKVGTITLVKSQSALMDAMINGYAAHSGQYAAWDTTANSQHYHPRISPGWNHDLAIGGYDDTKKFWPFRVWFLMQEWGNWNQPPKEWPADYPPWVPGMIVVKDEDFQVCIESEDCWVYSGVDGYPAQRLPDLGSIGLLNA